MTESLDLILQSNLAWLQGVVTLLEQPPLIWFVGVAILFVVLNFIKSLITR